MIDGDPTTAFSGRDALLASGYAWVQLAARSRIERIRVRSPAECVLRKYSVLVSDQPTPATPSAMNPDWTVLRQVASGQGDESMAIDPRDAYHVAVMFDERDCGVVWGLHSVSEIEAWTEANVPPPALVAPSCSGGISPSKCGSGSPSPGSAPLP
jgi:hypothetical protein